MAENLLASLPNLTEKDRQNIAKAVRRKGRLTEYPHFGYAANASELGLLCRQFVIEALQAAARMYPEVLDTIRKLETGGYYSD